MKKILLASAAVLVLAGSTAVYAQHRPWHHHHARMNPEDRAAFADARIAAVHAGLKLTPDQEKLWPPVEAAAKDFAKLRIDRANARMAERQDESKGPQTPDNPVVRLQQRADTMAATAAALKKIAETADPLYKTLDDGQKRRLAILTHMDGGRSGGREGMRHRGFEHRMDRMGDRDDERGGMDRDRPGRGMDHDRGPGPERM
ncbi:Spy/CpxP family protein refolding chaperone [Rhodopseudomonas sp. P2A-2r]|uniref:Spy/CpxP family protein refolding chaperone n=1 Tax=unclassified Rhodopseudomonas TaxID=2638247 RepID=UPI0022349891|nr:Spy/CpxP family protein refolding chaperone [Rhodopseudomonas sp. P2A-2r]UZE47951.1 Spy/CpxP family protein refolding chaperone [Rhodopseudomonas sp. P2A-2r]